MEEKLSLLKDLGFSDQLLNSIERYNPQDPFLNYIDTELIFSESLDLVTLQSDKLERDSINLMAKDV